MLIAGRYQLTLSAPQWAYLCKLEVFAGPNVEVQKQADGSVIVILVQQDYSTFLQSTSEAGAHTVTKPKAAVVNISNINIEIDASK